MSATLDRLAGQTPETNETALPLEEQPVIAVEQATLAYGRHVVLQDVAMSIRQGEFWCFLGPNGQGKTTLIKALLGALRPRRGRVRLRNDFARRTRIGYVPQECELNSAAPTTVSEFILSGLVGVPLSSSMRARRLERLLTLMGLRSARSRSLWRLSGGQRQRAMVARALIRDPLLLIVDEPTAGLDLGAATGVLEMIHALRREHGITIAFVTHDLQIAARRASHAALFHGGRVIGGPMDEVFVDKNLSGAFGVPIEVRVDESGERNVVAKKPRLSDIQDAAEAVKSSVASSDGEDGEDRLVRMLKEGLSR